MKQLRLILRLALAVARKRLTGARRRPPCPFRMEMVLELMQRRNRSVGRRSIAEIRRREVPTPVPRKLGRHLRYETLECGGVPVERITPTSWAGGRILLYLHGGGYNVCSPATHRGLTSRLALATGARVIVPDYRLAPEHPYPAALEDALAVYRSLLEDGAGPERLAIGGDSAGGGLSLAALVSLRASNERLPGAVMLLSPWVDLTLNGDTIDSNEASDYCWRRALEIYARNYLADLDPRHPLASPLYADLTGLPPLLIQAGGAETLLDDSRTLAERALTAGVEVELEVTEGAIHVFHAFAPMVPGSTEAIQRIGAFVQQKLA